MEDAYARSVSEVEYIDAWSSELLQYSICLVIC